MPSGGSQNGTKIDRRGPDADPEGSLPPAGYTATRVIRDMAEIVDRNTSTIIFTNTRSGAERISHRLKLALPELAEEIECHHSSLDRDLRLDVEDRLKMGLLRAVVCSTSLELGIDIGHIDTVIMVSTPKGRFANAAAGGALGSFHPQDEPRRPRRDEHQRPDRMRRLRGDDQAAPTRPGAAFSKTPTDVIAQHVVGMAMAGGVTADEAFAKRSPAALSVPKSGTRSEFRPRRSDISKGAANLSEGAVPRHLRKKSSRKTAASSPRRKRSSATIS